MNKRIWARIKIENLIYEIAMREARGDYGGGEALRQIFWGYIRDREDEISRKKNDINKFYSDLDKA